MFSAYDELVGRLGENCQMVAAVSFGHPAESPAVRPRKSVDEIPGMGEKAEARQRDVWGSAPILDRAADAWLNSHHLRWNR